MQDKIQNVMMYGDKASRAILSNPSYQFFGKGNEPDTAKYYERFFEIVKKEIMSINRGHNLNFDTRITTGEREIPKIRADVFFRLKQGEFSIGKAPSQKEFLQIIEAKEADPIFTGDIEGLLRPEISYDQKEAFTWLKESINTKM